MEGGEAFPVILFQKNDKAAIKLNLNFYVQSSICVFFCTLVIPGCIPVHKECAQGFQIAWGQFYFHGLHTIHDLFDLQWTDGAVTLFFQNRFSLDVPYRAYVLFFYSVHFPTKI